VPDDRESTQSNRESADAGGTSGPSPPRELLSDLFVNVVPIGIILVFVLVFTVLSPLGGDGGDPLLLFHTALITGVVLVSVAAGWVIRREDAPLRGSAARDGSLQSTDAVQSSDNSDHTRAHDGTGAHDETGTHDGDRQR